MREILFRGKRKDNGEWVKGSFWDEIPGELGGIAQYGSCVFHHVDLTTVGQFTGLYNAAGQKIWEGDIVRFGNANYVVQREDETPGGYWASTAYIMKEIGVCDYMSFVDTIDDYYNEICVEIIGNIHDNPELLEV